MTATKRIPDTSARLSPRTFGIGFMAGVIVTLLTLMILDFLEDDFSVSPDVLKDSKDTSNHVVFTFPTILERGEMPKATEKKQNEDDPSDDSDITDK